MPRMLGLGAQALFQLPGGPGSPCPHGDELELLEEEVTQGCRQVGAGPGDWDGREEAKVPGPRGSQVWALRFQKGQTDRGLC